MKIACKVQDKPALVVGYAPGKKGNPMAIVICDGKMKAVKLRHIDLGDLAKGFSKEAGELVQFRQAK